MEKVMSQKSNNEFLKSAEWRKFQEAFGRRTFCIDNESFHASIIEHNLPMVGNYFYIPRGPVFCHPEFISGSNEKMLKQVQHDTLGLIELAKKENTVWIRIDPENEKILNIIKEAVGADLVSAQKGQVRDLSLPRYQIMKAPHDVQPKETLVLDISKSEESLLAEMKSKTRYNVKLAEKKGVEIKSCHPERSEGSRDSSAKPQNDCIEEFLRLNRIMSERQKIKTHSDDYYRKMLKIIPEKNIKLYLAKYKNNIIAANIVIFYGDTATYLHGASDDNYKNLMAPYLLQWRQIQDAKTAGCTKYDFFGVKVKNRKGKSWEGITRFKLGFAPNAQSTEFPGSYDIVINPLKYWLYRFIQKIKSIF